MHLIFYTSKYLILLISKLFFGLKIYGKNKIPKSGGVIFACNHISIFDPPVMGSCTGRFVFFMAKDSLFKNIISRFYMWNVNARPIKRGVFDRSAMKLCINIVKNGNGLVIFPEGTRSKTDKFLDPKPGIGLIANHAKRQIVPAYIHGSNRLSDCFWRNEKFIVAFGEPFSAEWVDSFPANKEGYQKMSEAVMSRIGEIRDSVIS